MNEDYAAFSMFLVEFLGERDATNQKILMLWSGLAGECWRTASRKAAEKAVRIVLNCADEIGEMVR